jgi:hypothetical protein
MLSKQSMEVKSLSFTRAPAIKSVRLVLFKSTFHASLVTKSAKHVKKNLELPAPAAIIIQARFILTLTGKTALAIVIMISMAI